MERIKGIFLFTLCLLIMQGGFFLSLTQQTCLAEEISITTYYPAPNGFYDRMAVYRLGVGDNDGSSQLGNDDVPSTAGDVWISGSVGIGTMNPEEKIHVKGPTSGRGVVMVEGYDAIFKSKSENGGEIFHLIGSYDGWDPEAIYIGGYNYDYPFGGDVNNSFAKRVYFGQQEKVAINLQTDVDHHALEIRDAQDKKVLLVDTSASGKKLQLQVGSSHGVIASDAGLLLASYSNLASGSPSYQSGLWIGLGGSEFYGDVRIMNNPATGTAGGLELGGERMEKWLDMVTFQVTLNWALGPIGGDYTLYPDTFGLRNFRGACAALNGFTIGLIPIGATTTVKLLDLQSDHLVIRIVENGMTSITFSVAAIGEPL